MSYSLIRDSRGRLLDPTDYRDIGQISKRWRRLGDFAFTKCSRFLLQGHLDCSFVSPQQCPIERQKLQSLKKSLDAAERFFSLPLMVVTDYRFFRSRHIVHLLFVKEAGRVERVEYFDSQGSPLSDYPEVAHVASGLKDPDTPIIQNERRFQWRIDPINCGAFVLFFLEQRICRGIAMQHIEYPLNGICRYRDSLAERLAAACDLSTPVSDDWVLGDMES